MDRERLLNLLRLAGEALITRVAINKAAPLKWKWAYTPVLNIRFRCPYCHRVVRSRAIFFVDESRRLLIGQVKLSSPFRLMPPHHPHLSNTDGHLCMGNARSSVELISSAPFVPGAGMSNDGIKMWLTRYFGHSCSTRSGLPPPAQVEEEEDE